MIESFRLFIIHEDHTYRFWSTWPFSCWIQSKKPWYPTAFFDFNYFCTSRFSNEFWMSYDIKYVGCADHQRETVTWGTAVWKENFSSLSISKWSPSCLIKDCLMNHMKLIWSRINTWFRLRSGGSQIYIVFLWYPFVAETWFVIFSLGLVVSFICSSWFLELSDLSLILLTVYGSNNSDSSRSVYVCSIWTIVDTCISFLYWCSN